jgi:hypothetical protein
VNVILTESICTSVVKIVQNGLIMIDYRSGYSIKGLDYRLIYFFLTYGNSSDTNYFVGSNFKDSSERLGVVICLMNIRIQFK